MRYNKINNLLGWLCFAIALTVYVLTLEPSVSFWDCGEFIASAFRLQVAHQPGYPLFAMLGKAFSLLSFGNNAQVPYFTNLMSAIASAATIMFLFWTITALAKKIFLKDTDEAIDQTKLILIMGAGLVGAIAFTFTDTFWFSAVETIVFALSSLCTAVVFWAILKWDANADAPGADKWIVLIAYVMGLSIGIHLLNLLTIPALVMVYYFRRFNNVTFKRSVAAFFIGIAILAFVQYGVRTYTIKLAASFDLFFVNTLGLGFGSGALFFILILAGCLAGGIIYSTRLKKPMLNLAFLCVAFIYFGYSSFTYIPIRAAAGTNLNNSHPDDAVTLYGYLNRIQYGETPLLYGQYFDANAINELEGTPVYRKSNGKYEVTGKSPNYEFDHNTFLPRMYSSTAGDPQFYREWLQLADNQVPTFSDNLKWMFSWQIYQMYCRYFMWNFVGRYSDDDNEGQTNMRGIGGNWTSGIFDAQRHLPKSIVNSATYTPLFAIPLILGLFGLFYHFRNKRKDALIVMLLFFFTGLAIVLYVNQPSIQPRERDYSYVGSFYAFAIWIGLGVIALAQAIPKRINSRTSALAATGLCLLVVPTLLAREEWKDHDRSTKLTAHDMAYNYLISCPKNAILFCLGDNETYSLWYDQEVEGIRPDVRIANLSLMGTDWSIRQMQHKINDADALPITMPYDKYKGVIRDVIPYDDAKIAGNVEIKDVFDFITSDDKQAQVQFQNGEFGNYLPTKNLKLTVNHNDVLKNKVVAPEQEKKITDTMAWTFNANYVEKQNLAMLDVLAHNNWKRPICFTSTISTEYLVGLQPYLYKEGFTFRLMPLKPDPTVTEQLAKTNSLVMYDNMMNKFKYGNFKTAKYLDHESVNMFYPHLVSAFSELTLGLMKDSHPDLARNALHKFDQVLPDITPGLYAAQSKILLADTSYKLNEPAMGNKLVNSVANYLTDQLNYNYYQLQTDTSALNPGDVQNSITFLNGLVTITKAGNQPALNARLTAMVTDYESKFSGIIKR